MLDKRSAVQQQPANAGEGAVWADNRRVGDKHLLTVDTL